jgi:hypothetical protein
MHHGISNICVIKRKRVHSNATSNKTIMSTHAKDLVQAELRRLVDKSFYFFEDKTEIMEWCRLAMGEDQVISPSLRAHLNDIEGFALRLLVDKITVLDSEDKTRVMEWCRLAMGENKVIFLSLHRFLNKFEGLDSETLGEIWEEINVQRTLNVPNCVSIIIHHPTYIKEWFLAAIRDRVHEYKVVGNRLRDYEAATLPQVEYILYYLRLKRDSDPIDQSDP